MRKEVIWYSLLFLINLIFITICITYVQTSVFSSFMLVDEKLTELEYKISLLTMTVTSEEEKKEEKSKIPTHKEINAVELGNLTESEIIAAQIGQEYNILNELYEYIIDITRTVHETSEKILFLGQETEQLRREFGELNERSNGDTTKGEVKGGGGEVTNINKQTTNGENIECNKAKIVQWVEFNPIKLNHHSFFTNAHKVMKSHPDWHTYDGEYTNSFLRRFVKQSYNFTIKSFERVDAYYVGDDIYTNGFSYFMDVVVDQYYENALNEKLNPYMQEKIKELKDKADENNNVLICSNCKLIVHANILADFNSTHIGNIEKDVATALTSGEVTSTITLERSNIRVSAYDPTPRVNFITTIYNVATEFERILGYIKDVAKRDHQIRWIVTDFSSSDIDVEKTLEASKIPYVYLNDPGRFNKIRGLNAAAEAVTNPNEILFFLDVDMYFLNDFSQIIRSRTIQGEQVFYPICYSFYSNGKPPAYTSGYYREGGLGNVGIYKSDFELNKWSKNGDGDRWGNEDNEMFDKLGKNYITYRTYEPQFFHLYHNQRAWHPV